MLLKKFSVKGTKEHKVWLIIGSRGTGKTTLVKDIISKTKNRYNNPFIMCRTKESYDFFSKIAPPSLVYGNGYEYEKSDKFLEICRNGTGEKNNLMVMDDCMYDTKVLKTDTQQEIHMNGRHYRITLINVSQYFMNVPCAVRANVDYVIVLKESSEIARRKLYQHFFGMFKDFKTFCNVFDKVTSDYGCIVLDRTSSSNSVEDCVRWYKADLDVTDNFTIGDRYYYT